ncbi:hypothetical protein GE061_007713 [Apolygus lucorum]|uniref:phosphatidylinositol N-acetylglucosaminyltransferase n=1 Tax=Apolygus lucorum TaxID=248454 RepID=A0A8S9WP93_APOLU|nr:hypothetical protein GE061_007713 [Apolygus lucorum]
MEKPVRICMASDFFFPNVGGVEEHIYNLSQCLLKAGYKVIVITHSYGRIVGVRYLTNGLKVFYLPIKPFYNQAILPTMIGSLPLIRYILVRERIDIVHGHSAFSSLAHEVMIIGKLMGLKTVFTDHSLFGFADTSAILTNKFLQITLANVDHCICVSHIGKENTVLRAHVNHSRVSVIPNAVDTTVFHPRPAVLKPPGRIVIVSIGRLVYRKGIDLLAQIIVEICAKHPNVDFLIGGGGPKTSLLEEIIERFHLHGRVTLIGQIDHSQVCSVLNRGHIFLNCSLTEAYCMAIVEAVACGLQVVCTKVGGIPEVLRPDLVFLREPNIPALIEGLECAMKDHINGKVVSPDERHKFVQECYNWYNVSSRTEIVYDSLLHLSHPSLGKQLSNYRQSGVWPFLLVVSMMWVILRFLEWIVPRSSIDIARDYVKRK